MRFKDEVRIKVTGGKGGDGAVGWRREKYVPLGGPDGGDGGNGGAIIFVVDEGLNTLIDFSFNPILQAENGEGGSGTCCTGRNGEDLVRSVPLGTQVFFGDKLVADLNKPGARWIAARGGVGGKGNHHFKSSTNQSPDYAQPGQDGDNFEFRLVLKSVADVGLVGFPNVGKSTLIGAISRARPAVADYPFTTLEPSLGVVETKGGDKFVVADIPGLIPGAHLGKGLGITFLKHIERTSAIAQLIDLTTASDGGRHHLALEENVSDEDLLKMVIEQFQSIDNELRQFSPELSERPRIVVFTKSDLGLSDRALQLAAEFFRSRNISTRSISSATHAGLDDLCNELARIVQQHRAVRKS